jgi:hypothetical protein
LAGHRRAVFPVCSGAVRNAHHSGRIPHGHASPSSLCAKAPAVQGAVEEAGRTAHGG